MKIIIKTCLISVVFIILSGCTPAVLNTYQGNTLSMAESGILTCEPAIQIHSIDGNTNYRAASAGGLWYRDCIISLAPGKHTVTFQYYFGGTVTFTTSSVTREVNIEKGQIYRIKYTIKDRRWKPWIEKLQGDELAEQRIRVAAKLAGETSVSTPNQQPRQNKEKQAQQYVDKNKPQVVPDTIEKKLPVGKNSKVGILIKATGYVISTNEENARKIEISNNFKKVFSLYSPDNPEYVDINNTNLVRSLEFEGEDGKVSRTICKEQNINYLISGIMEDEPSSGSFSAEVAFYSCTENRKIYKTLSSTGPAMSDEMAKVLKSILIEQFQLIYGHKPAENIPEQKRKSASSSGTGFIISRKGHIITNQHVIDGCSKVTASLAGMKQKAEVHRKDSINDLALLTTINDGIEPLAFRSHSRLRAGESVVALGFPLSGLLSSQAHVTTGTITALAGIQDDTRFLQMSAPVQPGNSGGPLLDSSGNVVGMVVGKLNAIKIAKATGDLTQNVNFALSAGIIKSFLDANSIDYKRSNHGNTIGIPEIVERAKRSIVYIECYK
jgi:S1-C subfamily serine protease